MAFLNPKLRADITRKALTVLQRYRFLFGLPKNIEKNIRNVSEYKLFMKEGGREGKRRGGGGGGG